MEKIRRAYAVSLTVITCVTCLAAGVIIAEKNTRHMCFGDEFPTISVEELLDKVFL